VSHSGTPQASEVVASLGRHKTKSPRSEAMCVQEAENPLGPARGWWKPGLQRLEACTVLPSSAWVIRRRKRCRTSLQNPGQTGIWSRKHADVVCHLEMG
jgi:hypothetical protein